MAHLLRGKQAGISNDLSQGLGPDLFVLDHVRARRIVTPPIAQAQAQAQALHAQANSMSRSATMASTPKSPKSHTTPSNPS
jgi:syntaxin-binding protein 5